MPVVEPEPVPVADPEPVPVVEPEPVPVVEPEPVPVVEPEPEPVVEPEPVLNCIITIPNAITLDLERTSLSGGSHTWTLQDFKGNSDCVNVSSAVTAGLPAANGSITANGMIVTIEADAPDGTYEI